jgi:hypothetical protein
MKNNKIYFKNIKKISLFLPDGTMNLDYKNLDYNPDSFVIKHGNFLESRYFGIILKNLNPNLIQDIRHDVF